jgi:hypothetical protein
MRIVILEYSDDGIDYNVVGSYSSRDKAIEQITGEHVNYERTSDGIQVDQSSDGYWCTTETTLDKEIE